MNEVSGWFLIFVLHINEPNDPAAATPMPDRFVCETVRDALKLPGNPMGAKVKSVGCAYVVPEKP